MNAKLRITVWVLVVLVGSPFPVVAQSRNKAKAKFSRRPTAAETPFQLPSTIRLSEEQRGELEKLRAEFIPRLQELKARVKDLTVAHAKERIKGFKRPKRGERKGEEPAKETATDLTERDELEQAREDLTALQKTVRDKVVAVLTEKQKKQLDAARKPIRSSRSRSAKAEGTRKPTREKSTRRSSTRRSSRSESTRVNSGTSKNRTGTSRRLAPGKSSR